MKNLIIPLAFLTLILSMCQPSNEAKIKQAEHDRRNDSIILAKKASDEKTDSLYEIARLKQAKIAFGDLKFGMTGQEVEKIYGRDNYLKEQIGLFFYGIFFYYNSRGELYLVKIQKPTANFLETDVKERMENLKEVISLKYGQPNFENVYPSIIDFKPKHIIWVYKWEYESKRINIGAGEESSDNIIYSVAYIYDEPMYQEEQLLKEKKEKEAKEGSKELF